MGGNLACTQEHLTDLLWDCDRIDAYLAINGVRALVYTPQIGWSEYFDLEYHPVGFCRSVRVELPANDNRR